MLATRNRHFMFGATTAHKPKVGTALLIFNIVPMVTVPVKVNVVSMVMGSLTGRMGDRPIPPLNH